jgi:hypothetical protein
MQPEIRLTEVVRRVEVLEVQRKEGSKRIALLERVLTEERDHRAKISEDLTAAKNEAAAFARDVERILHSRSWRMTAPLRWLSRCAWRPIRMLSRFTHLGPAEK